MEERKLFELFFEFFLIKQVKDLMNVTLILKNNMSWCAAYNCSNSSKNNSEKTFFTLPKNECTRKAWIAAMNREEGTLPKNVYVCSDHFEETCFDKNWALQTQLFYTTRPQRRRLMEGSVPTIFSHQEKSKEQKVSKKRQARRQQQEVTFRILLPSRHTTSFQLL